MMLVGVRWRVYLLLEEWCRPLFLYRPNHGWPLRSCGASVSATRGGECVLHLAVLGAVSTRCIELGYHIIEGDITRSRRFHIYLTEISILYTTARASRIHLLTLHGKQLYQGRLCPNQQGSTMKALSASKDQSG